MKIMSDFREAMWGLVQQGISTLDVDYLDYADEHFDRLLRNASRPITVGCSSTPRRPMTGDRRADRAQVVIIGAGVGGREHRVAPRRARAAPTCWCSSGPSPRAAARSTPPGSSASSGRACR